MVFKILFLFAIFLCEGQYDFSKAQVAAQASQGERQLWHWHRRGIRTLGRQQLQRVFGVLQSHHSRDHHFLRLVAAEMAESDVDWRCTACWRTNKANTSKCARCGIKWTHGCDPTYVPQKHPKSPRRWNYSGWNAQTNWQDWESSHWGDGSNQHQRAKTPKDRHRGSTPRKRNAGGKKEKHAQYSAPEVEPPWNANYSGGPSASTAGEDSSAVQEKLVILATAVQESNAAVNSNARQIVEEYSTPVPTAKGLKAAVDKMDKARKKLKDAEKARLTMHSSWRKYIADSLQRWTQFAEKFGRDDQELADRVRAAREKLQKTKEDVDAKKAALEDHDGEDHIDISDEDMAEKVDSSENIQSSLTHMVENLLTMKQQADAAIIEANENKAKRQRTDNNGDGELPAGGGDSSMPGSGAKPSALQPFAKPGK